MTMHFIQSQTVSSPVATVTFSSVPQTFTHLQLRYFARSTTTNPGEGIIIGLTDTTQTHYTCHRLYGVGNSVASEGYTAGTAPFLTIPSGGNLANTFGVGIFDVADYTNTSKHKTIKAIGGFETNSSTAGQQHTWSGIVTGAYLKDTTAISSISIGVYIYAGGTGFASGSRFDLYGITSNPIATGA